MSDSANPVTGPTAPEAAAAPAEASTKGGAAAPANYTAATTVGSMQELKTVAPKVYEASLQGIAMRIVSDLREASARLKKIMREGRDG